MPTVAAAKVPLLRSVARTAARSFGAPASLASILRKGTTKKKTANEKENSVASSPSHNLDTLTKEYLDKVSTLKTPSFGVSVSSKTSDDIIPVQSVSASPTTSLLSVFSCILKPGKVENNDEAANLLSSEATRSLRVDETHGKSKVECDDGDSVGGVLKLPLLKTSISYLHKQRKSVSFVKKKRYFKWQGQSLRFTKLVKMCARIVGPDAAIDLFAKMGQHPTPKQITELINACLKEARSSTNEDLALEQFYKVYQIFKVVKESGLKIVEEMYGQFLMYLIDNEMVDEFFLLHGFIQDENFPRSTYYEMLLWIRVNNEAKIKELFLSVLSDDSVNSCCMKESLVLAFAESKDRERLLMLLETLDITRVGSVAPLEHIFGTLGMFLLESHLEKYLLALKESGIGAEKLSSLICEYIVSMPNLEVEDAMKKLKTLNARFDVLPISTQYERIAIFYSESLKVHEALLVVHEAVQYGLTLSLKAFHMLLDACDRGREFYLAHKIFSIISGHSLIPDASTFRRLVYLCVRMKDFEGAYKMIEEMKNMKLVPTAVIYNTILGGYFREKNSIGVMKVLKQMKGAGIEPDSLTYSYLIHNSTSEKDISKLYDHLIKANVQPTKQVFMALINAYASCGQIEKAREVIMHKGILGQDLNDIKNVLVQALASNGQFSSAFEMYEELKDAKCHVDSKTIKCLIAHLESGDVVDKSIHLLEEINDSMHWNEAFFRIMACCFQIENLGCAANLLHRLKDKFIDNDDALSIMFDEVFCIFAEKEPTHMRFGLSLLEIAKEEVGIEPTRKSLDFLLCGCVSAKDSASAFVIWKEYKAAGFVTMF